MDLKNESSNAVQGTVGTNNTPKTTPVNVPHSPNKAQGDNKPKPTEQGKAGATKPESHSAPKPETATAEKEPVNTVIAPPVAEPKKVMTIQETLKELEKLQVLRTQYENLLIRQRELESFEFKQMEENDELQDNPYAGCTLIIKDDNMGQFVTRTPGLIKMVTAYLKAACLDKQAELESRIIFPAA